MMPRCAPPWASTPCSRRVGTSPAAAHRSVPLCARARNRPSRKPANPSLMLKDHVEVAAEQRRLHWRSAGVGHVDEAHARRRLFKAELQQVVVGADAGGAKSYGLRRLA